MSKAGFAGDDAPRVVFRKFLRAFLTGVQLNHFWDFVKISLIHIIEGAIKV